MKENDLKDEAFPITTRQAVLSDESEINDFLKKAYGGRFVFKYPDRWNWEYCQNPYWKNDRLPIYLALHENKIIGQTGAMYVPFKIGGKIRKAAWSVDTIVLPEYRGKGIGKRLQKMSAQNHEIFMSLRSSEVNRKIKAGFGSITLVKVPTYIRWVKVNPVNYIKAVEKWFHQNRLIVPSWGKFFNFLKLNRILLHAINFFIKLRNSFSSEVEFDSDFNIIEVDNFPNEIDEFWKELKEHFDVIVMRDKKYLDWRYVIQPYMNYRKFIAQKSGRICGILVLRVGRPPEANVGVIAEILVMPNEKIIIRQLLKFAVDFFDNDIEAIKCTTSVKEIGKVLKEFSFSREHVDPFVFFSNDGNLMENGIKTKSNFLFSMGDHDYDQYPLQKLRYKFSFFHFDAIRSIKSRSVV